MLRMKLFTALFLSPFLIACSDPAPRETHLSGRTMGTTYNVKYFGGESLSAEQLQAEIDEALVLVNKQMSTWDPESELSLFNKHQSSEPFAMSAQTLLVLNESKRLGELTGGVLDVTVGPLVNLWGFGPDKKPETIPSDEQIALAKANTGLDKLLLSDGFAAKTQSNLYVDLSTIAKGYGVDVVADLLEQKGIVDYLVEIGGEMRLKGQKPGNISWRVAVEKPVSDQRAIQRILEIGDNAIATSGDYRNYYEENGVRYSHLIDPNTGYPINHNTVSVAVIHPSSMTADGLATALNVMGKEKALAFADENNIAILLITRENSEFKEYTSASFDSSVNVVN